MILKKLFIIISTPIKIALGCVCLNNIKDLRVARKISQQTLAEIVKVHQTAISQWETGRTYPDMSTALLLADYFNVTTDYLLGRTDDPTPPSAARPAVPDLLEGLSDADRRRAEEYVEMIKQTAKFREQGEFADELKPKLT